jgi:hypothetical protein
METIQFAMHSYNTYHALLINRGFIALGKYVSMRGHIRTYLKKKETGKSTSERAGLAEYIYTAKYR